jgi:hypothetical protein
MLDWLEQSIKPGVLGHYTACEITEILAFNKKEKNPINVLSVIVLQDKNTDTMIPAPCFLNKDRVKITKLKDWYFGIYRYYVPIDVLINQLKNYAKVKIWSLGAKPITTGNLRFTPPQFVPPTGSTAITLNQILKNNFWN